jgi:hypothetical protein
MTTISDGLILFLFFPIFAALLLVGVTFMFWAFARIADLWL